MRPRAVTVRISRAAQERLDFASTIAGAPRATQPHRRIASARRIRCVSSGRAAAFRLSAMTWSVHPEPTDEVERAALLDAVERALPADAASPLGRSRWWRAGL